MKAHFLAALLSATYYEVDATAFNFTSDTTATFTNDDGKAFNATFDGVNVFFYCHGANHVENIALNAPVAPALVECEQIIYHTTKDSGVIALKITTENGKFRYIGKYGAGCGLNIDGIKELIKNNLEWHKKMTLISGVDLLETAPVAPAIVEPVTILDVAPAIVEPVTILDVAPAIVEPVTILDVAPALVEPVTILDVAPALVEPVTILDVAPALVEPVTIQTNYLGIKTMGNYKNKAQARRFMAQKVTEKIIEMVTAGDFVVPEQTCAATFTGNAVLRDFALVLAEDAHNSGFGFSKCQFDLLKPDYMRCMVLDDVFGYWSKTADDLRAKLREIQAQRAAVSDISPALVEPVTVLDVAPALVEPVTILEVAPALVEPVTVLEVAPALVEPVTVLEVAPALVEPVTILEVAPAIVITDAVIEVPLASITLSSEVKQFKNNANKTGVVEKLTGKFERAGIKITLRDVASFMRANAGRVLLTVNTQNFGDDLGLNSLKKDDFHAVIYDAPTKTFTSKTGGRFSFDNTNRDFSLSYFSEGGRHGFEFRSNYQTFIIFAAIFEQAAPVVAAPVVVDALQSLRDLSALAIVEPAATVSTPALPCEVSTVAKPLDDAVTVSMVAKPCNDTPIDQDWNKENYDIERKQSMTQHGAMKGKLFAENEAKEFTKLTGKNHTVVIEGSHIFDSKGCFENGKFDGQRFNLYRAVQCDEPPTGNNEHKKPVVKETLTTEKPKFKLQPRTTSLTKMARAGIMVLGWFFARELFNAAGQGKIREFLSQGLKMAWNFDALTVADFARFFAQCTDDTKAAKVYALYCQVMPCPLSLEDLMRLSARLNLNPITAQYRRLSIEETRHAMH